MRPSENLESNLLKSLSHVGLCDPMDCSPPTSSVHRDSPGKNNGVGCHALLQGIFPMHPLLALFFPHGALVPSSQVCILSVCSLTAAAAEQGLAPRRYSASAEPVIAMENTVSTGGKNTHFAVLVFFFFFWPCHTAACRILVPRPAMESYHWATRQLLVYLLRRVVRAALLSATQERGEGVLSTQGTGRS